MEGLVIDAIAEVGGVAALLGEDEKRPTYTLSGRRRWKGVKYQSLGGGQPNATAQRPGVIDVRLSSELQTAQRAAAPVVRHGGLVAALAAVMACVSLVAGVQGSAAHMHILPALAVVLLGVLACGATILLQSRRGRGGLHPRNSQQPMQGSGKFDTPAATFQSLGGSSVPSFGSRPNTALSVGSAAGSPDLSPATDSIMGSTRQVVRFTSAEAEVFASRASPSGLDPSSSRTSHAAGGETSPLMPLCRALVLPSNEAHLQIQLSALSEAARDGGEFYILGPLGNRLLRTEVEKEGAARSLEIFMASASDTLARNARVAAVVAQGPGAPGLLITGPNGQAYGEMVPRRGGGGFAVLCPNRPLPALLLVGDAAGLQLSASSGEDGRHLASTSAGRAPGGGDRLEVRVRAGVDTALVLSCILAAVVFS